jgi:UPF0755 protein
MKYKFIFVLGLLFIFSSAFIYWQSRPVNLADSAIRVFTINRGDGIVSISRRLLNNQFIRNRYLFILKAYLLGLHRRLQAGTFRLSSSDTTTKIITLLSSASNSDYWLTITPGSRLAQLSVNFPQTLEGYLFPDSYLIPPHYTAEQIANLITTHFHQKLAQAEQGSTTSLDDRQTLILASLLEREAKTLTDKQLIAGILLNRLSINMALQVDATLQYARDTLRTPKNYWQPLNQRDFKIASPFNTYLHPGLPPAPICNPGLDSLSAAYHPRDTDYMYYISDFLGTIHFARTLADHNQNIDKYLK